MGFGFECSFPGFQGGVNENRLETENGYKNFTTIKVGAENSIAFKASYGPTLDLYWKTDAGKNKPTSELILGTSNYMSAGGGLMITYSWTENDEGKTTMRGLSFSLGAGAASGKQYTFESIGKPKAKE